jgi:hypothetical protein
MDKCCVFQKKLDFRLDFFYIWVTPENIVCKRIANNSSSKAKTPHNRRLKLLPKPNPIPKPHPFAQNAAPKSPKMLLAAPNAATH